MTKPSKLRRLGAFLTRARNFVMNTLFIVLLLVVLIVILDAFETPGVPDGSALVLNPEGVVVEETVPRDPFQELWASAGASETDIHELVRVIERSGRRRPHRDDRARSRRTGPTRPPHTRKPSVPPLPASRRQARQPLPSATATLSHSTP